MIVTVDFGGTSIRVGLFDPENEILLGRIQLSFADESPVQVLKMLVDGIQFLYEQNGLRTEACDAIITGVAALLDTDGVIRIWPNRPKWNGFPFLQTLNDYVKSPVWIFDDAELAAIGEYYYGWGKGRSQLIHITVGTGIGSGIIVNGKVLKGNRNATGEIGHMCVEPYGIECSCGGVGCLQLYASGRAIERMAKEHRLPVNKASEVFSRASANDSVALQIVQQAMRYLEIGIANAVKILDPELVVIGGGLVARHREFYAGVEERVRKLMGNLPHKTIEVRCAQLQDDAALWGGLSAYKLLIERGTFR